LIQPYLAAGRTTTSKVSLRGIFLMLQGGRYGTWGLRLDPIVCTCMSVCLFIPWVVGCPFVYFIETLPFLREGEFPFEVQQRGLVYLSEFASECFVALYISNI
jgi:hypothetical protein